MIYLTIIILIYIISWIVGTTIYTQFKLENYWSNEDFAVIGLLFIAPLWTGFYFIMSIAGDKNYKKKRYKKILKQLIEDYPEVNNLPIDGNRVKKLVKEYSKKVKNNI